MHADGAPQTGHWKVTIRNQATYLPQAEPQVGSHFGDGEIGRGKRILGLHRLAPCLVPRIVRVDRIIYDSYRS